MKKIIDYLQTQPKLNIALAVFWTLGILYGCSLPGKDLPTLHLFDHFDKVIHFVFFLVFALLWYATQKINLYQSVALSIAYGIFIECYQKYFVAGRSFDVWDIVADAIGALVLILIVKKK